MVRPLYCSVKQRSMPMPRVRLSSKSQVVVPAEVRRILGVGPGDEIDFVHEGSKVVVRKAARSAVDRLAESAGSMWQGYADELQRERDEWDR
ncbi:MAG: AbrB/MazE/SpoVT family DNA-binding domain-containing protein [Longimicrobiaceae bacterium]